ncbi:MAG: InlB B-repeat-containing protein, partial [Candidatus Bathyarchaeota archaeon]|uniref:InlB B-repeat-containing protein n=1 Tax=Candidatus Bathycorpusculum sp. TaxID=2994959 RepID=UPI002820558F|nr:InlB B-repeat-containing protein [Candidatus Termiticorpusculum sp.]MCL2256833.1 InlB B-repeat-containing protein [Candidatus Termiticorpusculum sp.]
MSNVLFDLKSSKLKKALFLVLTFALLSMLFLPVQESFAAPITGTPTGVNGRILSASMAGDTSDWVEIARNGDYSLIVRKNYINLYPQASYYGNPTWQYTSFGATNSYTSSTVRNKINDWFNGRSNGAADKLAANARLRSYTMQNNAVNVLGTSSAVASLTNGFSQPTNTQMSTGNDVAFALSYSEAAEFISKTHDVRTKNPQIQPSNANAISNYGKITIPNIYCYGAWLRSPGDISDTGGILDYTGRVFQFHLNSQSASEYGLVYPALWVNSAILDVSYTINYVLNGGVNAAVNPTTYNASVLPLSIANPSRSGYAFMNWQATFANGSSTVLQNGVIPTGTTGNVTLTATWSIVQYAISYVLQGGTNAASNPTMYNVENAHLLSIS